MTSYSPTDIRQRPKTKRSKEDHPLQKGKKLIVTFKNNLEGGHHFEPSWLMPPLIEIDIVGTPGLEYPLLLCLDKSLVVIPNYPFGPEPYSPGKRPRTRSPLGEGPVTPRVPEEVALSQNSWGPRTPIYYLDPSAEWNRHPAWCWSGAATCP